MLVLQDEKAFLLVSPDIVGRFKRMGGYLTGKWYEMTTELYENPIRVGFPTKDYKAKPSYKSWKLRKDSALKLLKESDNWEIKRTRDRNLGERCTRSTDSDHYRGDEPEWEEVDEELIEHLKEKIYEYDYNISVNPEDDKMRIWSNALGEWELRNPDFEATEGME